MEFSSIGMALAVVLLGRGAIIPELVEAVDEEEVGLGGLKNVNDFQ